MQEVVSENTVGGDWCDFTQTCSPEPSLHQWCMIVWVTRHWPLEYNRCGSAVGFAGMEQRRVWELRVHRLNWNETFSEVTVARWVQPSRVNSVGGVCCGCGLCQRGENTRDLGTLLLSSAFCYIFPSDWSRSIFVLFSRMRNLLGTPLQVLLPLSLRMTRKMVSSSAGVPTPSATHLWRNASPLRASQTARARLRCTDNSL